MAQVKKRLTELIGDEFIVGEETQPTAKPSVKKVIFDDEEEPQKEEKPEEVIEAVEPKAPVRPEKKEVKQERVEVTSTQPVKGKRGRKPNPHKDEIKITACTVRLTQDLYEAANSLAAEHGLTFSDYMRSLLCKEMGVKSPADTKDMKITNAKSAKMNLVVSAGAWNSVPQELRTDELFNIMMTFHPDALRFCYASIGSYADRFTKEQWLDLCQSNPDAIRYIPKAYLNECVKLLRE